MAESEGEGVRCDSCIQQTICFSGVVKETGETVDVEGQQDVFSRPAGVNGLGGRPHTPSAAPAERLRPWCRDKNREVSRGRVEGRVESQIHCSCGKTKRRSPKGRQTQLLCGLPR